MSASYPLRVVIDNSKTRRLAHTAERVRRLWISEHGSDMTIVEAVELALLDVHPSVRAVDFPDEKLAVELGVEAYRALFSEISVERERQTA